MPVNQTINVVGECLRPPDDYPSTDACQILEAALTILRQGEDLLLVVDGESYIRKVREVFNGSIGGHYRHCLDHFSSLLNALGAEEVNYDDRKRDAVIESQPGFALNVTRQLKNRLEALSSGVLDARVKARCEVSYARGDSPVTESSWGRELVYCIAHAIHHYALISVMAKLMNLSLPEHFGIAPSTVMHQASQPQHVRT